MPVISYGETDNTLDIVNSNAQQQIMDLSEEIGNTQINDMTFTIVTPWYRSSRYKVELDGPAISNNVREY